MQYLSESWAAQMCLTGLTAFGVCYVTGRLVGDDEPKKKKQERGAGRRGPAPGPSDAEHKLDRIFKQAEAAMQENRLAEAEACYNEALALTSSISDPMIMLLENVFCQRLALVCEKQHKYEEAEKHLLRSISTFEGRNLAPQEFAEYEQILERTVELCMSKLKNPEKAVRPLTLWLRISEDMDRDYQVLLCCNLLMRVKQQQGGLEEASQYGAKALALARKNGIADEIALSTMFQLIDVTHELGKHEENKRFIGELAVVASAINPPTAAANVMASLAGWCYDHDYYVESQNLMTRAVGLSRQYGNPNRDDIAQFESVIVQSLAERGNLNEARELCYKIAASMRGSTPPLTISRYLKTNDAVVLEEEGGLAVCHVKLYVREAAKLPHTAIIDCKVDNPAGGAPLESQQMYESDRPAINFRIVLPFAVRGYVLAQVDIFTDATKANRISSHFVLCQSESDISTKARAPSPAEVPLNLASFPAQVPAEVPLNFTERHIGNETVIEAHVGDTTVVGTTDGETTVITATDGDTTIIEAISENAIIKETITGDVHIIEGTNGEQTIKEITDGETTILETIVGDQVNVEVFRNEDSQ